MQEQTIICYCFIIINSIIKSDISHRSDSFSVSALPIFRLEKDMAMKSYYKEGIYFEGIPTGLNDQIEGQIQTLLGLNKGVGIMGGYYEEGLPICLVSVLTLDMLHYGSPDDFLKNTGYFLHDCFTEEDAQLFTPENFRHFNGEKQLYMLTASGEKLWVRIVKSDAVTSDGSLLWLISLNDFDAVHRHELSLIAAKEAAERANTAKTSFLSRMSHDIRTPLNGMLGMARIAKDNADDPEKVRDALSKLELAGKQLEMLINDVLDMSKLESGKTELVYESFNLRKLLTDTCALLRTQTTEKGVTINALALNEEHDNVIGSKLHLQRIIENISSNAIKYNRPGGSINYILDEIPEDDDRSLYRFTISDTGIGMSPEFMQHLFEPFAREDESSTRPHGTGLGLAITKDLIELMGGTVNVESKQGSGTTFIIDIPFKIDHDSVEQTEDVSAEQPDLKGARVLLVEDNEMNRDIAEYMISRTGADVISAKDGYEALDKFNASEPGSIDLIFMDIMMPGIDGLETTKRIRASKHPQASTIPVIALTANAFAEDINEIKAAGMDAHIAKPVNEEKLNRILTKFIKKK